MNYKFRDRICLGAFTDKVKSILHISVQLMWHLKVRVCIRIYTAWFLVSWCLGAGEKVERWEGNVSHRSTVIIEETLGSSHVLVEAKWLCSNHRNIEMEVKEYVKYENSQGCPLRLERLICSTATGDTKSSPFMLFTGWFHSRWLMVPCRNMICHSGNQAHNHQKHFS